MFVSYWFPCYCLVLKWKVVIVYLQRLCWHSSHTVKAITDQRDCPSKVCLAWLCVCARDYAARQRVDFDLSCHCQMIHLRPRHRRRRKRKTRTLIRHNKVNEKSSTIPSFLVGMWSIFALLARLQSHRQCVRARKHYAQFMTPPSGKKKRRPATVLFFHGSSGFSLWESYQLFEG